MTIHMLFLAGSHSYEISQDIAKAAKSSGIDGIAYPSYFSLVRTGTPPFETAYGISVRRIPVLVNMPGNQMIRNLAIFGYPIREKIVNVKCINRLIIKQVTYDVCFGPVMPS
jgi:hypothetical protein